MIAYKIDVLEALKEAGYTTYKLRKEKIMGEATLQQLREGRLVSWANMDTICDLLNCQPGDLLIYSKPVKEYNDVGELIQDVLTLTNKEEG